MPHADAPPPSGVVDAHVEELVPATPAACLGARVLRVATNPHLMGAPGCAVFTTMREGSLFFFQQDNLRLLDVRARWNSLRMFTWDALQEQKDHVMGLDLQMASGNVPFFLGTHHERAVSASCSRWRQWARL